MNAGPAVCGMTRSISFTAASVYFMDITVSSEMSPDARSAGVSAPRASARTFVKSLADIARYHIKHILNPRFLS